MKKILELLVVACCCFSGFAQTFNWDWVNTEEQPSGSTANRIATDLQGNVYVGGQFSGTSMVFGETILQNSVFAINKNQCFLAKYDVQGNVVWAKAFNTGQEAHFTAMKVDADGSILVSGFFYSSVEFDGFHLQAATYRPAGFLARISPEGSTTAAINLASDANNTTYLYPYDLDTDSQGNVYVAGRFMNNFKLSDDITLTGFELQHYFLVKYNASFQPLWAKGSTTTTTTILLSEPEVAVGANDDVFLSADYMSSINFGSGAVTNPVDGAVFCLAKFSPDGTQQFLKTFDAFTAYVMDMKTDMAGNLYLTGNFDVLTLGENTLVSAGSQDCFVAKLDAMGEPIWSQSAGGPLFDRPQDMVLNGDNLYVCGFFHSQQFQAGASVLLNPIGTAADFTQNGFIMQYDLNGNVLAADAPQNTGANNFWGMASNGTDVYACGTFKAGYDLGNVSFSSASDAMVVAKINSELLGLEGFSKAGFSIAPNPVSDNISVSGISDSAVDFSIFNLMGQSIKSGKTSQTIDVVDLQTGLYILIIDGKPHKFMKI